MEKNTRRKKHENQAKAIIRTSKNTPITKKNAQTFSFWPIMGYNSSRKHAIATEEGAGKQTKEIKQT
ncbi:MAG: hypothetical protein MJZ82_02805 [Paludibacteraceae bacterium]|nr:hypothetical protein [Paludibacteraceae bacterium]